MSDSQKSEGSVTIDRLGDTRRGILEALRAIGGEGNTSEVRRTTEVEIPEGSTRYHFRWLSDEELIREVSREEVSHGGRDVIVWSLTDAGAELLERIDEEEGREDRPQTIEGLNDRIDELEESLKATQDNLPEIVSELVERELKDREK